MDYSNISSNGTGDDHRFDSEFISRVMITCVFTLFVGIAIIGNFIILIVIPRIPHESINDSSKIYYMALSLTDLVTGILLICGPASKANGAWIFGDRGGVACKLLGIILSFMVPVSSLFIMLLNIDRYLFISKPLTYHQIATRRRAVVTATVSSVFIVLGFLLIVGLSEDSFDLIQYQNELGLCLAEFSRPSFLPFAIVLFTLNPWLNAIILPTMYCKILTITLKHSREIEAQRGVALRLNARSEPNRVNGQRGFGQNLPNFRLRTLRTPLLVTSFFILAFLPLSILEAYRSATAKPVNPIVQLVISSCVGLNTFINIFIYYVTKEDFRREVKRLICGRRCTNLGAA